MLRSVSWPWPLLAGALLAAAGFAGGYALASRLSEGRIAKAHASRMECVHARAQEARAAAQKTAQILARAQEAEAQAAARLAAAKAETDRRLKEARRDIYALTTGRECLGPAVRLRLNAAIAAAADVPEAAGGAAHAAAGAGADPGEPAGADERAVGLWIAEAIERYEDCRARIDAVRAWDAMTFGGAR